MPEEPLFDVTCPFCQAKWQLIQKEVNLGMFYCEGCKNWFDIPEAKYVAEKS